MDTQCRKELMKQRRLDAFIRREEYEESMNKLPINERAIIKDVLSQINAANLADKLEKLKLGQFNRQLNRQHHQRILKQASEQASAEVKAEFKAKAIGIMCMGTLAYVGLTLITR
jgi:hypothetical protein